MAAGGTGSEPHARDPSVDLETRFWPFGALMEKFALGPQFHKTIKGAQREFKAYVESRVEKPQGTEPGQPRAVA